MDISHRRIELQAPEDFTYLINNVRRAAADSINAAFPPVPDGDDDQEDELRVRIEQMVNEYITKTFTLAAPNISINGMPFDASQFLSSSSSSSSTPPPAASLATTPIEQYEPFDVGKRQRVEELAREEEDLLRAIATLKRRVPVTTAGNWAAAARDGIAADEAALETARSRAVEGLEVAEGEEGAGAGDGAERRKKKVMLLEGVVEPFERQEGVERGYSGAVGALGRLKRDMPATVAKMERARVAGAYVVTGR